VTPYFYPGREFRRLLCAAAARGVDVRLLMQGKPDYRFAAASARVLYEELLGDGVRIFEYLPAFLHAKVMVVDGHWSTVGSSNIDPLSMLLNLEANLVIEDTAFTEALADDIGRALDQSDEITAEHVRRRGWASWARRVLIGWAARAYLRLAGFTGRY
jgi:cardiolipin synthase A/B